MQFREVVVIVVVVIVAPAWAAQQFLAQSATKDVGLLFCH
jgi:hypothetical protein